MKRNVSGQVVGAQLNAKADGSAVTTGTTTVYVTGDGGTQAVGSVGSGACTHEGQGFWTYAPAQAETDYAHVAFTLTNTAAVAATVQIYPSFPQTGDNFARLGAPVGASISADIAGVQSDTNDIQTRLPAALVSGRIDASVGAMATGVLTATAIAADAITDAKVASDVTIASVTGAVGSVTGNVGGSVGSIATGGIAAGSFVAGAIDAAAIAADAIGSSELAASAASEIATAVRTELTTELGRVDVVLSTRASQSSVDTIAGFVDTEVAAVKAVTDKIDTALELDGGVYRFTTNALEQAPGGSAPTAAAIADAVWDETLADHLGAGSTGNALNAAGSAGDPWSTALPGAYGAGTAGKIIGDNVNATISSRASQASVDTVAGFVDTEVAAIKAKTDNLPSDPADESLIIAATDAIYARLGAPAGASVSADVAAVKADTAAILIDTAEIGTAGAGLTALASAANLATVAGYLDTEIAAIKAKTDALPADPADASDLASALAAISAAIADKTGYRLSATGVNDLLRTALTEGYAADTAEMTVEQALHMIWSMLCGKEIVGTTLTTRKLDGATAAMTFTLDSGTSPTSQARAT